MFGMKWKKIWEQNCLRASIFFKKTTELYFTLSCIKPTVRPWSFEAFFYVKFSKLLKAIFFLLKNKNFNTWNIFSPWHHSKYKQINVSAFKSLCNWNAHSQKHPYLVKLSSQRHSPEIWCVRKFYPISFRETIARNWWSFRQSGQTIWRHCQEWTCLERSMLLLEESSA